MERRPAVGDAELGRAVVVEAEQIVAAVIRSGDEPIDGHGQVGDHVVATLARDITNTLATAELSDWLSRHDADRMLMSQAEFAAFVVSEADRAAKLLSSS